MNDVLHLVEGEVVWVDSKYTTFEHIVCEK